MTTPAAPCAPTPRRASRWRDGMLWLVGGIIAMVVGGNAVMIWIALQAQPNLVREDYYEASKRVDSERAVRVASARLGWQVSIQPEATQRNVLVLRVFDAEGRAVPGLSGSIAAYRPADAALDQPLRVEADPAATGQYRATFARPAQGLWRITVDLTADGRRLVRDMPVVMP